MKKFFAIALYLVWGCILVLGLTFGGDIAVDMILSLREFTDAALHHVNITDVQIDLNLEERFLVEKYVYPQYTAVGDIEGDPGLQFETLDPNIIRSISKTSGYFCGARTEQEKTSGRIRITSQYDPDFEKIITVHFEKKYPQNFEARYIVKSSGALAKNAYVGVPIYTYMQVKSGEIYSERDYEIVYNPEYFKLVNEYTVVPIKETPEGEDISLTYVYGNGASSETKSFVIKPTQDTQVFDEIRLNGENAEGYEVKRGYSQFITLFKEGKKVVTDYEIIAENPEAVNLSLTGYVQFIKAGAQTFTICLPNGFSKRVTIDVYNIIEFPTISGVEPNADGFVECKEEESLKFNYEFDKDVTYKMLSFEYDKEILTLTRGNGTFSLKGRKAGETTVKVILDDGEQYFEEIYKVRVLEDKSILKFIRQNSANLVSKGIGHMGGFFVLALFTVNMLRFFKVKGSFRRILFCSVCGGVFAVLTETIQFFIPLRSPSFTDIFIDMGGFYLGILLLSSFVFKKARSAKIRRREVHSQSRPN